MKQRNVWMALVILAVVIVLAVYFASLQTRDGEVALEEQPVTQIMLSGPITDGKAELSGLAWVGDNLVLLPQYPNVFDESGDGFLYYIPKAEIIAYLDGTSQAALEPHPIQLVAPDLTDQIRNYQGFESIGFSGQRAFLTIESGEGANMQGYLISGVLSPDLGVLLLDTSQLTEISPQAKSENHTDESILVLEDKIITFYEVNGEAVVADPVAHVFDYDLNSLGTVPMVNLEYRLTDTALASANEFWGIDYFFPGDTDLLPESDPVLKAFGMGKSQVDHAQVERLVKFQYSDSEITFVNTPPVLLTLENDARNWEGLVVLGERGFLMATDKFPSTILAFVPMPK